jgi:hypothetical protein
VTPTFNELSSVNPAAFNLLNRKFGAAAATKYGNLQLYFQAVLLNTVAAVADAGVNLSEARFEGFYFGSNKSAPPFGVELSGITKNGLGNLENTAFGYRSPSSVKEGSVEATFERGGNVAFDVDLRNPNGNLLGHGGEVVGNKLGQQTTDPRDALKALNDRGVQTGVRCQ